MKSPPYRKRAVAMLRTSLKESWGVSVDGTQATVWALVGDQAWNVAKHWLDTPRIFIVIPDMEDYDYRALAGHDPLILLVCGDASHLSLPAIGKAMITQGIERVLLIGENGNQIMKASNDQSRRVRV